MIDIIWEARAWCSMSIVTGNGCWAGIVCGFGCNENNCAPGETVANAATAAATGKKHSIPFSKQ